MHYSSALVVAAMASSALAAPWNNHKWSTPDNTTTAPVWVTSASAVSLPPASSAPPASTPPASAPPASTPPASAPGGEQTTTVVSTPPTDVPVSSCPATVETGGTTVVTAAPPANTGLSLTQQLFIADTAADRFALLPNDEQFVFKFNNPMLFGKGGKGGDLVAANRKTFPALVGSGSGMAVGFLGPCGFNTPHVHLRETELQIVVEGSIVTEMVPENGVFHDNDPTKGRRVIKNTLGPFDMTPFYQGSVHTQFNPDCSPTTFVASFNSEDFGTGQVPDELFAFDADVVSAAFGQAIDGAEVEKFKGKIPASIAFGVESCLAKCGIAKR